MSNPPIDAVVARLKSGGWDPKECGAGKWRSRCPSHQGKSESLSITEGDDGTVLVNCHHEEHGGKSCDANAIARSLGLELKDLFPPKPGTSSRRAKKNGAVWSSASEAFEWTAKKLGGKISGTPWIYESEDGKSELMHVCRIDIPNSDKQFRPAYRDAAGWHLADPPGSLPLYNLSNLAAGGEIIVVEGEKCADIVNGLGLTATTSSHGCKSPQLTDWSPLAGKTLYVIPDNDPAGDGYAQKVCGIVSGLNPAPTIRIVNLALKAKGDDIEQWVESLPPDWDRARRADELMKLARAAKPWAPPAAGPTTPPAGPGKKPAKSPSVYAERDGCLYAGNDRLANFTARIERSIVRHEGGSEHVRFGIVAKHARGHERRVDVESDKYSSMGWVYGLGAEFALNPGREVKDLARHGIQILSDSDGIGRAVEHTSLGWIRHEGQWLYLHAGGAIGAAGPSDAVRVDIPPPLDKYRLPTSPDRRTLERAIEMHKDIWSLAKQGRSGGRGAAAIVATGPWRAILSPFDASVHFGGPSGNMKTSMARIALQHLSDAKGRHAQMPADWRSTANALQRLAFDCRDSLLIVDDLKLEEHIRTAEVIIQSQGNLQSRLRMNIDQSVRQPLDPRGSLLSTGEIDPRTLSTRGRVLMVEMQAGDIDTAVLSRLQCAADEGLFAALMSAYLQSLAGRLDKARETHQALTNQIRASIGEIKGSHPRHPDIIAQLVAAYRLFTGWAVAENLIPQITADSLVVLAQGLLIELCKDQVKFQDEAKAGRQFLDLLASALQSGRCHLLDADSEVEPKSYPQACGWRAEMGRSGVEWKIPGGSRCIGFISSLDGFLYLDPTESQAMATEMAKHQHNPQSFASVGRELLQEGLVESTTEAGKTRASRSKRIHGVTKRCFFIKIDHLFNLTQVIP
jgi:Domain of unknown function (DUF927)